MPSIPGSETSTAIDLLSPFCIGSGLDLGFGGLSISKTAINIDQAYNPAKLAVDPQHLTGDATNLKWFRDNVLDYVFSSHLLEDFPPTQTMSVLVEWLRVIKPGGNLVLLLPNEPVYKKHCDETGQSYNLAHQNHVLSLDWFKANIVPKLGNRVSVIFEQFPIGVYSFAIVLKKNW